MCSEVLDNTEGVVAVRPPADLPIVWGRRVAVTAVVERPAIECTKKVLGDRKPAPPVESGGVRQQQNGQ